MADKPLESSTTNPASEHAHLPPTAPPRNHGHTVAAWVTVSVVIAGAAIAAIGLLTALPWLFWTGLGVAVLGVVIGGILRKVGFGQPEPSGPVRGESGTGDDVAAMGEG